MDGRGAARVRTAPGWRPCPKEITLPGPEVHVWLADVQALSGHHAALAAALSPDETARAARFRFERDRRSFEIGRGVLRHLLGHYLHARADAIRLDYAPDRKPYLPDASLRFNISHSGQFAVLAFAWGLEVGVDIEQIDANIATRAIAEQFFSEAERAALGTATTQSDYTRRFFACWTRKEAYIKARGVGLSLPLRDFDVSVTSDSQARLLRTRPDPTEAARWRLADLPAPVGYRACVAHEAGAQAARCWWFDGRLAESESVR
jgi:4'-phosphopantetheinyl transferase